MSITPEVIGKQPSFKFFLIHRPKHDRLDLPRLIDGLNRKREMTLAMTVVLSDRIGSVARRIPTLVSERPYHLALAIAGGALAIGLLNTAVTHCNLSLAERSIHSASVVQSPAK